MESKRKSESKMAVARGSILFFDNLNSLTCRNILVVFPCGTLTGSFALLVVLCFVVGVLKTLLGGDKGGVLKVCLLQKFI